MLLHYANNVNRNAVIFTNFPSFSHARRSPGGIGCKRGGVCPRKRRLPPGGAPRRDVKRVKRGEVYRADLDPVLGSEQGGTRPVLIVQNNLGNQTSPTVIVVPLTSQRKKLSQRTHVSIEPPEGGLAHPSLILCEQVRTLEKTRLTRFLGALSPDALRRVDAALAAALGADAS